MHGWVCTFGVLWFPLCLCGMSTSRYHCGHMLPLLFIIFACSKRWWFISVKWYEASGEISGVAETLSRHRFFQAHGWELWSLTQEWPSGRQTSTTRCKRNRSKNQILPLPFLQSSGCWFPLLRLPPSGGVCSKHQIRFRNLPGEHRFREENFSVARKLSTRPSGSEGCEEFTFVSISVPSTVLAQPSWSWWALLNTRLCSEYVTCMGSSNPHNRPRQWIICIECIRKLRLCLASQRCLWCNPWTLWMCYPLWEKGFCRWD